MCTPTIVSNAEICNKMSGLGSMTLECNLIYQLERKRDTTQLKLAYASVNSVTLSAAHVLPLLGNSYSKATYGSWTPVVLRLHIA